jgi:hypothetical protein
MPATAPQDVRYLDLADYLYLAGAALDVAPEATVSIDILCPPSPLTARPGP